MKKIMLFILVLAVIGILINLIPVSTYFFGTEIHEKYNNDFSDGLSLDYSGIFNLMGTNSSSNLYGFIINLTKINGNDYSVQSKLYILTGEVIYSGNLLPSFPFQASRVIEIANYSGVLNINDSLFLSFNFPDGNVVKTSMLNFSISNSTTNMLPTNFVGYPDIHSSEISNSNFTLTKVAYVSYGSQYVMTALMSVQTKLATSLFTSMFPNYSFNESFKTHPGQLLMYLGYGNGVPAQDWLGWFEYGFSFVFPLNVILLLSAGIIAIFSYRKVH